MKFFGFFDFLISIIYPHRCVCCKRECKKDEHLCAQCIKNIVPIQLRCQSCGNPLEIEQSTCYLCKNKSLLYRKLFIAYFYEDPIKPLLRTFKYDKRKDISSILDSLLKSHHAICELLRKQTWDYIVPVPLHPEKEKQRGYNQSVFIAEILSQLIKTDILYDSIERTKNTEPLFAMEKEERQKELENVFNVRDEALVRKKRILLVDDIITTGSTINECAKALHNAGSSCIDGFAFAHGR